MEPKKLTTQSLRARKSDPSGAKIIAVTAYDFTFARLADELVDVMLVGDSLGMVIQGNANTLSVSVDQVIYHCAAVAKAARHAHVVADMPFLSYQASADDALRNAGAMLAKGNAESVKVEGGVRVAAIVERMVDAGIPVMGHIGLTPQSVHSFGGYKIQGKTENAAESILQDALALEDSGAYAIVLEGIPSALAKSITERVKIPTIGIGAGIHCDGQILVSQDLLGMNPDFKPRFVKQYTDLASTIKGALKQYAEEVREGQFPTEANSF